MKKTLVLTASLVLAVTLLYFSPLNSKSKGSEAVEEIVVADVASGRTSPGAAGVVSTVPAPAQVVTGITQTAGSAVSMLDDGTSVTTVDDGKGNRVESRFFNGDRQIKGIIVNTASDGSKQIRIMLADGSSRLMSAEPVANVIRATPSQIATALGVFGDLTIKTTPTPFVDPEAEPEPSPAVSPTVPTATPIVK